MEEHGTKFGNTHLVDLRDHRVEHLALEGAEDHARVRHIEARKPRALPYEALQPAWSE